MPAVLQLQLHEQGQTLLVQNIPRSPSLAPSVVQRLPPELLPPAPALAARLHR